ncbi:hypothetical protein [Paenibacillus sp. BC26]|uniref:hypothetical protein n=1 Tax=Paenibacillus sp. BC26 TaxID=1881032 RepID=UPI0008EDB8DD|nr:hypothetical protein [Paenibacillus sp. BC26]SFS77445.1 hypothetical protein SAMN05428962_2785 [Paenibacillus sp. BC26]
MNRMPFERPTEHYDERVSHIDEQICELLKQRNEISNNNPGYPPFEYITKWAMSFDFYEDYLKWVFNAFLREEQFKPIIVPTGFRRHIPILKSFEEGGYFYSLTSVRQYTNASVITFNIDWDMSNEHSINSYKPSHFELYLGDNYDSRMDRGGSSGGHSSFNYVVSPALPDDISYMNFVFREFGGPHENEPRGAEITIRIE